LGWVSIARKMGISVYIVSSYVSSIKVCLDGSVFDGV
jgi:hypothetical protein